ncbi:MAG: hypothetical protein IKC74_01215 [Clostridia bacterium]|nr:hypothetical protein [Clostridia bacterium]
MNKTVQKIRVTPEMIINDMGLEYPQNFFCEFDTEGDPLNGIEGEVPKIHPRKDGWWIGKTNLSFTVELDGIYRITNLYFYNNSGSHKARVRMGTPFTWEFDKEFVPDMQKWCGFDTNFDTRYVNFEFNNNEAPSEIIIYGYKTEELNEVIPPITKHKKIKLDKFVGMNGFVNDADDISRACSYIREYHSWTWTGIPNGMDTAFSPNPSVNLRWNFDDFYKRRHSFGIDVCPTLTVGRDANPKDTSVGDTTKPEAYISYAAYLFQYVARYGSNKNINPELIKVAEGQEKKIGLGYISYVEPLNEPNGTWLGRDLYYSPFELAAFLSICYDGHEGKFKNIGVKQADPNCKMSMSGLAGINFNYIRAMSLWCKYNRKDGKLPFDAINMHHYCGKAISKAGIAKNVDVNLDERGDTQEKVYVGVSAEEGDIVGALRQIGEWRDRYAPHLEYWLTEFGWDTNQDYKTSTSAHAYGEYTGRQVQAMWLVREYLLLSSADIDRAAMYMSRDCGPEETTVGKYGTSGLVRFPIEHGPYDVIQGNKKDSFYYVYTLKHLLSDTYFDCEIESNNESVRIFKYVTDEGKSKYALWCVTADGTKVPGMKFRIPEGEYKLVKFVNESVFGKRSDLEYKDGYVTVDVSENPIFVVEK